MLVLVPFPEQAAARAWNMELSSTDKTNSLLVLQEHMPLLHTGRLTCLVQRFLCVNVFTM